MSEPIFNKDEYNTLNWTKEEKEQELQSSSKFEKKKRKELLKLEKRRRKYEIYSIQTNDDYKSKKDKHLTTSKLFMYIILVNCIAVELYSMWIMYTLQDLSALYSLIGAVIGESISYAIYCTKSFKENKEEAYLSFEREKFDYEKYNNGNCGNTDESEEEYVEE